MMEDFDKKKRLDGRPPRLIPGTTVADPKIRIFIMVGLLVMLILAVVMLKGFASRPEAREIETKTPPSTPMPTDTRFSGVPTLDRGYIEEVHDATPKEREGWDEKAIAYLLAEVRATPAVLAYRRKLVPLDERSAPAIEQDPKPWRFQFVRFRGELESMTDGDYSDLTEGGSDDIGQVYIGRVRVAEGAPPIRVKFVTTMRLDWIDYNEPGTKHRTRQIKDGWVRGRGIFVKNYLDVGADGEQVPTFLIVATNITRDFETVAVDSLESIPFQIIKDAPGLLDRHETRKLFFKTYPKPLFRLVKWAGPRAGPEGAALREKEGLKPRLLVTAKQFEEVLANPQLARAKYFGGLGALAMDPHFVAPEDISGDKVNDAGIQSYITGWIVTDKERLMQFVAPESLHTGLKRRARVRFAGYFYKVQGYYARSGEERMVPMLVLTVLEELTVPPPDKRLELFIAIGFVIGIALLVFIIVREDRTKQDYRRSRRGRKTIL